MSQLPQDLLTTLEKEGLTRWRNLALAEAVLLATQRLAENPTQKQMEVLNKVIALAENDGTGLNYN